jgi:hypothetical protein
MPTESPINYLRARNPVPVQGDVIDASDRERSLAAILAEPVPAPSRRVRSRGLLLPLGGATALVAASLAVVLLFLTGGGPSQTLPAAVAAVGDQLGNASVVHAIVTGDDVDGAQRELWAAADGSSLRYRTIQGSGNYIDVSMTKKGDAVLLTMYRSADNTLYRYPWTHQPQAPDGKQDHPAIDITSIANFGDAVRSGNATVTGEITVRGVRAYEVVPRPASPGAKSPTWVISADANTPKLLEIRRPCPTSTDCPVTMFRFYEVTSDRADLNLPPHSGARVVDVQRPESTGTVR